MITAWTKGITDLEEKQRFQTSLMHCKWAFERLTDILGDMEKDLNRSETNPKNYDTPNWDYRQAHNNGYRQCLDVVRKIITLDPKDTTVDRQPITATS